jgi:hypothetical protein
VVLDRPIRYLIALTAVLTLVPAVAFAERELADGTVADQWTLANGLKVVTRHVPGADAVAIVVAYPNGRDSDPAGQEGLSALMAEAAFSAAAGEIPARTHAELESQRPVGWNVQTERHRTEFAEMATPEQFPGVLHQVATRMRSVKLTDDVVSRAREALRERQRALIDGDIGAELYLELGQRGAGWDRARFQRWRSAEGITRLRARDLSPRVAESYVPARAVLSLAGDFEGINLRAFIEREFGGIPSGTKGSNAMPAVASGGITDVVPHGKLDRLVGGVGIVAPALSDSLHPSFFLTALVLGAHASQMWGGSDLVRSRFQFSILDDPSVARLYPPIQSTEWSPENLQMQFFALLQTFSTLTIELNQMTAVREAVDWLLGGPLSDGLAARVPTDHAVLYRLCSAAATRELWGGEAFWSQYRRRFDPARSAGDERWPEVLKDPALVISVLYAP